MASNVEKFLLCVESLDLYVFVSRLAIGGFEAKFDENPCVSYVGFNWSCVSVLSL